LNIIRFVSTASRRCAGFIMATTASLSHGSGCRK